MTVPNMFNIKHSKIKLFMLLNKLLWVTDEKKKQCPL